MIFEEIRLANFRCFFGETWIRFSEAEDRNVTVGANNDNDTAQQAETDIAGFKCFKRVRGQKMRPEKISRASSGPMPCFARLEASLA